MTLRIEIRHEGKLVDPEHEDREIVRILRQLADNIEHCGYNALDDKREATLRDSDGNVVGRAYMEG